MKIQTVLFDGFGELVSFAPFEVLKRAIEEGLHLQLNSFRVNKNKKLLLIKVSFYKFYFIKS